MSEHRYAGSCAGFVPASIYSVDNLLIRVLFYYGKYSIFSRCCQYIGVGGDVKKETCDACVLLFTSTVHLLVDFYVRRKYN